ncbi:MAG: hypothetical protein H0X37_05445 [Herpetosiphonaceae bacterium]|nr:hypothetical protein [Herpetosiphonaceae bacterium]
MICPIHVSGLAGGTGALAHSLDTSLVRCTRLPGADGHAPGEVVRGAPSSIAGAVAGGYLAGAMAHRSLVMPAPQL